VLAGIMLTTDYPGLSHRRHINATSIGNIAFESLSKDQEASILGRTSRGIFISTSSRWLNYISSEPFRGPLTITLPDIGESFPNLSHGMHVHVESRQLIFPDVNWEISTYDSELWHPQLPASPPIPVADRQAWLIESSEMILKSRGKAGLAPLLPALLDLPSPHLPFNQDETPLQKSIIRLKEQISKNQHLPFTRSIIDLLGQGSGLTPSSDDFIIGFFLALNRWKYFLLPIQNLQGLNGSIVAGAYEKTTTLSANLIECATLGLADERLIEALDWLMVGTSQDSQHLEKMLSWGSSSGVDVFVGFVAACSYLQEP
jgi:hypothetical protein